MHVSRSKTDPTLWLHSHSVFDSQWGPFRVWFRERPCMQSRCQHLLAPLLCGFRHNRNQYRESRIVRPPPRWYQCYLSDEIWSVCPLFIRMKSKSCFCSLCCSIFWCPETSALVFAEQSIQSGNNPLTLAQFGLLTDTFGFGVWSAKPPIYTLSGSC